MIYKQFFRMFKLKYIIFTFCIICFKLSNGQYDSARVTPVEFAPINSIFVFADNHTDSTYSGIDTVFSLSNKEIIMVLLEYKSGRKVKATGYYDNGQKYRESFFKENTLDGLDTKWYKNGKKEFQTYSENGIEIFPLIIWYENGKLESYSDYNQKENKGTIKVWYENGYLKSEITGIDSTELGCIEKYYYETGELSTVQINNMGNQEYIGYHRNGNTSFKGHLYNAIWNSVGKWQEWYENGVLKREYYFDENTPNIKVGTWSWWDEEGNLIKQEIYENNKLIDTKEFVPMKIRKD